MTPGPQLPPRPGRVRVTAPRNQSTAVPTTVWQEVAEHSAVGEVMVHSLIRSQLRLALVIAGAFVAALFATWVLVTWLPDLSTWRLAGIPASWLLLGLGMYPLIGLCAWLFVRAANRNEKQYRDLVDES